jgi:hypothetical protein
VRDVVLTPIVVLIWALDTRARRAGRKDGPRCATWYWNRWWRIGYSGPFQFGWLYKRHGLRPRDILIPHLRVWKALR